MSKSDVWLLASIVFAGLGWWWCFAIALAIAIMSS